MADKEIYKEKVIIHHDDTPRHTHIHEYVDEDVDERRQDWRTRGEVRSEIMTFRRGVYLILNIIELLLVAEFVIKLFALPATNPILSTINALTYPLIAPFGNLVTWISPYFMINWSILFAIVIYGLFAYLLTALFESGIRSAYRH